jgi:hypothetical protein
MPLSEILFEVNDPVAARLNIKKLLETNDYKIKEYSLKKIIAEHKMSFNRFGHLVEVEFDPPTEQCIVTTITLRIDHHDSKTYIKFLFGKLAKVVPKLTVTSVKPDMFLDYDAALATVAEPLCKEIGGHSTSGWRCPNCGLENKIMLDMSARCGTRRHDLDEVEPFPDTNEDNSDTPEDSSREIY